MYKINNKIKCKCNKLIWNAEGWLDCIVCRHTPKQKGLKKCEEGSRKQNKVIVN